MAASDTGAEAVGAGEDGQAGGSGTSAGRAVVAASGSLSVGVLPIFLLGALSDRIGDDLGFGAGGTGVVVAVAFSTAALCAIPLGVVSDRIGARRGVRLGVVVSAVAAGGVGLWAESFWQLVVGMGVAGSVIGLIDTGSARLLTDLVRQDRQGVAFGIKEASVPAASMIAGASIPLVAERFGWRPLFATGAVVAPLLWALLPAPAGDGDDGGDHETAPSPGRRPLVVFAVGAALAVGAATAAATFLVPAAKDTGLSSGAAGVLLAAASVVAIAVRVFLGAVSDRRPGSTTTALVGAMALGAVGATMLAFGGGAGLVAAGAVLVLGAGWGWTGLAFLSAVRSTPDAPSTAAGVVLTGLAAGGVGGPAVYGFIVSAVSYQAAWAVVAVAMVIGAVLCGRARLR